MPQRNLPTHQVASSSKSTVHQLASQAQQHQLVLPQPIQSPSQRMTIINPPHLRGQPRANLNPTLSSSRPRQPRGVRVQQISSYASPQGPQSFRIVQTPVSTSGTPQNAVIRLPIQSNSRNKIIPRPPKQAVKQTVKQAVSHQTLPSQVRKSLMFSGFFLFIPVIILVFLTRPFIYNLQILIQHFWGDPLKTVSEFPLFCISLRFLCK